MFVHMYMVGSVIPIEPVRERNSIMAGAKESGRSGGRGEGRNGSPYVIASI